MLFCDVEKFVDQFFWCKPSRKNFVNMFIQMKFRSVEDALTYLENCNITLTAKCKKQSEQIEHLENYLEQCNTSLATKCKKQSEQIQHLENILQSFLSTLSKDGNPDMQKMEYNK